jgi:hypothetical protein
MSEANRPDSTSENARKERAMNSQKTDPIDHDDANRDPLSGQPGSHPVGTGIGAAGVGTAATVVGGVVGGPVGAVVGAVVGSVVGGLAGKSTAESMDPTQEDNHWRENYRSRPYVEKGRTYEDYQPAYRTGFEGYAQYGSSNKSYSESELDLQRDYEANASRTLTWDQARHATKDAWERSAQSENR